MTTAAMVQALTDPMGVPFYPRVFQALGVLTFSLHILFVNVAVGAAALAVYGRLWGGGPWRKLSAPLAKAATAAVSAAILLGVAPLLFIQVLYDPFWYASNSLSAAWVIGFVFVMMAGYGLLYVFVEKGEGAGGWAGLASVLLFLTAGCIMHAL
ncbi:MAG: hypothetical protein KGL53_11765, partial [Elusimicrobia bacterium]|nr:hypothetical protein [Elusimicrobiota bacterium]